MQGINILLSAQLPPVGYPESASAPSRIFCLLCSPAALWCIRITVLIAFAGFLFALRHHHRRESRLSSEWASSPDSKKGETE